MPATGSGSSVSAVKHLQRINTLTTTIEDPGIDMTKRKLVDNLEKIAKAKTEEFGFGKKQNEVVNNIRALSWRLRVLAATSSMFGEFGVGSHSTHAASDRVRLADRNYEHEILESAAGGSVTEQKDTETIHGEDKREEEYVSFYKSMSGDWEDHSLLKTLQRDKRSVRIVLQVDVW